MKMECYVCTKPDGEYASFKKAKARQSTSFPFILRKTDCVSPMCIPKIMSALMLCAVS